MKRRFAVFGRVQWQISNVWKFVLSAILLFWGLPAQAHVRLDSLADREHNPVTGRFLSPDPSRFSDSRNLYALTGNDPVNKADPDGRCSKVNVASVNLPGVQPAYFSSYGTHNTRLEGNALVSAVHAAPAVGTMAPSMIPGVGEAMDAATLFDNGAGFGTRTLAGVSLAVNVVTLGVAPNFGAPARVVSEGIDTAADAAKGGRRLLTAGIDLPNAGGVIRSFVQESDQVYYRVFSDHKTVGSFLIATPPRSSAWAQEALSLPPGNTAHYVQEVLVPAGTRLQRSRALPVPEWGRFRGGAEQFWILPGQRLPPQNFGPGVPLP